MTSKMKTNKLQFNKKAGDILAFYTERGTISESSYSEFNCCTYTGDDDEHTTLCRDELCSQLGICPNQLITARQTHSTNVAIIDDAIGNLYGVDGLVTKRRDIVLGVFTADCVPVVLCDPVAGVVAAVHAGWKGAMNGIAAVAVEKMVLIGANPQDILVAFGPAICQDCFEVGEEVVEQFAEKGLPTELLVERNPQTGKAHIDLVRTVMYWLMQAGVSAENICRSGLCTKCNPNRFFSARNLGINSGRVLTGIRLL